MNMPLGFAVSPGALIPWQWAGEPTQLMESQLGAGRPAKFRREYGQTEVISCRNGDTRDTAVRAPVDVQFKMVEQCMRTAAAFGRRQKRGEQQLSFTTKTRAQTIGVTGLGNMGRK